MNSGVEGKECEEELQAKKSFLEMENECKEKLLEKEKQKEGALKDCKMLQKQYSQMDEKFMKLRGMYFISITLSIAHYYNIYTLFRRNYVCVDLLPSGNAFPFFHVVRGSLSDHL